MDKLLGHLGFIRHKVKPKWIRYEHAPSDTVIVLVDKKPTDPVRPTDVLSARLHLILKGLISEDEFGAFLSQATPPPKKPDPKKRRNK
jgi:hypothetical protein